MFISSVILYFNELPVGYEGFKEDDHYRFERARDSKSNLTLPPIRVYQSADGIETSDVHDPDLIKQLSRIVGVYPFDHFHHSLIHN